MSGFIGSPLVAHMGPTYAAYMGPLWAARVGPTWGVQPGFVWIPYGRTLMSLVTGPHMGPLWVCLVFVVSAYTYL